MTFKESETVELKASVTDTTKKEIVAFANSRGGTIYVGVADGGEIVGVKNTDECILQISNMVRDSIKPDVTMFVHYETLSFNGKSLVAINVQSGTNQPYYLSRKGLRPEGVYVRQGTSSVPATDAAIRQMIKETDGDNFEKMRSINQSLTFETLTKEFELRNIDFGKSQMQTLKIISSDGLYTNLGLLLSEQCQHSIKAAVFEQADQSVFKDRREFFGSLLKQLSQVYDYIDFHNQTHATFNKLLRIDTKDYPEVAVREALLNCIVHRDYSFSASTLISIYSDRIEFVSLGGILPGLELEDIMMGVSVCRNPQLANVFYRLQLIEAYGIGMKKIMNAYKNTPVEPQIATSSNTFKIVLPNINANSENKENASAKTSVSHEEKVLQELSKNKTITRKDVEKVLKTSSSTAGRILNKMTNEGKILRTGGSKKTCYTLCNKFS